MTEETPKEMSLEVAQKSLPTYVDEDSGKTLGLENYKPATQFGYLKIDQDNGEIEYTLTGEKRKEWKVVIGNFSFSRIMFEEDTFGGAPLCKTKERRQNQYDLEGVGNPGGMCEMCDYSKWNDRKKPPCRLNLNLSGLIEGNMVTPVGITCAGANFKVGTQLLDSFSKDKLTPWTVVTTVSLDGPFTKGKVSYYTFKFQYKFTNGEGNTVVVPVPRDISDTLTAEYINSGGMSIFGNMDEPQEDLGDEVSEQKLSADEMEDILLKPEEGSDVVTANGDDKEEEPF